MCGVQLRLAWVQARTPIPAPPVRETARPASGDRLPLPDNVALARPSPVYRGAGSERQRQWGAATDVPAAPGDQLLIVAPSSGKTWFATVADIVGSSGYGHLVTLTGGRWQSDPEPEDSP